MTSLGRRIRGSLSRESSPNHSSMPTLQFERRPSDGQRGWPGQGGDVYDSAGGAGWGEQEEVIGPLHSKPKKEGKLKNRVSSQPASPPLLAAEDLS